MKVAIDRAGRIVVPKQLRDELGLSPGTALEIEVVDGHLEISPPHRSAPVIDGPFGPVVGATGRVVTDADVRRALEGARART